MDANKFKVIEKEYNIYYNSLLKEGKLPLRDTGKGFWGHIPIGELFEAFKMLKLNNYRTFIDLGSGDGKVVLVASLFCQRAVGIEIDNELHKKALEIQKKVLITNAIFYNNDFFAHSISEFDSVFVYPDQPLEKGLEKKLLNELNGKLIHCGHHFHPTHLKKESNFQVNGSLFTVYSK